MKFKEHVCTITKFRLEDMSSGILPKCLVKLRPGVVHEIQRKTIDHSAFQLSVSYGHSL